MLAHYAWGREGEVRKLRSEIPSLQTRLDSATDREECSVLQRELATMTRRLDALLAVPPLTADDMRSDCATPISKHGWITLPFDGPCPAWPGWAARLRRAREILEAGAREAKAAEPPAPKPEPLAVIASGLAIAEVLQRLHELQAQYPDAVVRRGRANRWELWPKAAK